ncbi:MAG: transposase [bacterium]|nr:transposase [bacterium]
MPRAPRIDVGGQIYHVINRANSRQTIFESENDYRHFERLLKEAVDRTGMRILAYVLMPNHWHLILHSYEDGDLSSFMQWLTLTHTQQYHAYRETIGYGHVYQGRYKSFLVEDDNYLLAAIKYVERNPVRARLTKRVEGWQWGSGYRRLDGTVEEKKLLARSPVDLPSGYRAWINQPDKEDELEDIRISVNKGKPFGTMRWVEYMVERYGLELTTRKRGRPKKGT